MVRRWFRAILLLAGVIFLGYLMIWIVVPSSIWLKTWLPTMLIKTNTKEFGTQGAFLLIFTLPILIIAVLGSVYLHLTRNIRNYSDKIKRGGPIAELRKPMLVRGPLGVVSAMELILFFLFIALIAWTFIYLHIVVPVVTNMNDRQNSRHVNDKLWLKKFRSTSFYYAIGGNICTALLFFPVTRGSSILPLLGLTSEGSIKYHMWMGNLALFCFTIHGLMFVVYWAVTDDLGEILKWDQHSVSNVPGELALLFGLALWVTTYPGIRRKMFELFYYTHHLYIPFMFFYMLHTGFYFFSIILPGFYLFLIDRYLRILQSRQKVQLVSARVLPCEAVELNFSKSLALEYTSSSFISINVPSISSMQWHPFTICSNSSLEPDRISVIIKKNGNWTQKLYEKLASSAPLDRLEVSIEGPYGPASADFLRYQTLVLLAGGSGITPMVSIIRELIFRKANIGCPTPRVVLICAFKHSVDLSLLNLILPLNGTSLEHVSQLQIEIEAYVTRDECPIPSDHDNRNTMTKTIRFRPHPSDEPFSAVLGSYAWLWLGAIIMSSFVLFILLTGFLGRFYISPKDKNTNKVYSWSSRASMNILFLCASIITTSTFAVLWNKRSKHGGHVLSSLHTELESLPEQSIVPNKVHFGARPNLRKILLNYEGSSTGVLVCGPATMRHKVAKICASRFYNLHCESVSYSS